MKQESKLLRKVNIILAIAIIFFGINTFTQWIRFENPNTNARIILALFIVYYLIKYRGWIKKKLSGNR